MKDFESFLRFERQLSELTIKSYLSGLMKFKEFISGDILIAGDFNKVTQETIRNFLSYLKEKNISKNSTACFISSLRVYYKWLTYSTKKENIANISFFLSNIVKTKRERPLVIIPTAGEVAKLRKVLDAYKQATSFASSSKEYKIIIRDRVMLELLAGTGMRSGELRQLHFCDINLDKKEILIRAGKGGYQRIAVFQETTLEALRDYFSLNKFNPEDLLFTYNQGTSINFIVKRWAKRAALDQRLHAHSFRYYFISETQRLGAKTPVVAQQVGHRNLNSTLYYTRHNTVVLQEEFQKFKF